MPCDARMATGPERYPLTQAHADAFRRDGWVVLPDFIGEAALRALEHDYMRLLRREVSSGRRVEPLASPVFSFSAAAKKPSPPANPLDICRPRPSTSLPSSDDAARMRVEAGQHCSSMPAQHNRFWWAVAPIARAFSRHR